MICYWCRKGDNIIKCWTLLASNRAMKGIYILQLYQSNWRANSITEIIFGKLLLLWPSILGAWNMSNELQLSETLHIGMKNHDLVTLSTESLCISIHAVQSCLVTQYHEIWLCSILSMDATVDFTETVPVPTLPNSPELESATSKLPKEVAESFSM